MLATFPLFETGGRRRIGSQPFEQEFEDAKPLGAATHTGLNIAGRSDISGCEVEAKWPIL